MIAVGCVLAMAAAMFLIGYFGAEILRGDQDE